MKQLNEILKKIVLKSSLRGLFKSYGEVVDVVAHSNLRMRGQAFVSFTDPQIAKKAMKEVKGFPLYSKPMVSFLCCSFFKAGTFTIMSCSKYHSQGHDRMPL